MYPRARWVPGWVMPIGRVSRACADMAMWQRLYMYSGRGPGDSTLVLCPRLPACAPMCVSIVGAQQLFTPELNTVTVDHTPNDKLFIRHQTDPWTVPCPFSDFVQICNGRRSLIEYKKLKIAPEYNFNPFSSFQFSYHPTLGDVTWHQRCAAGCGRVCLQSAASPPLAGRSA